MAPPRKRRFFTGEEVREILNQSLPIPRADSDSDGSESDDSSEGEEADDYYSPTRRDSCCSIGIGDTEQANEDEVPMEHDSDSEIESHDDEAVATNNQREEEWIHLEDTEEWCPSWLDSYADGPKLLFDVNEHIKPVDLFYKFFPEDVFTNIADQTNLYAKQMIGAMGPLQQYSRFRKWHDTDAKELKAFTALQVAMGLVKKPALHQYWEENWLVGTPGFGKVMSRNRYELLNTMLHFADNSQRIMRGQQGYDPLYKVKPIMNMVLPTYQASFCPGRDLSIDESLAAYKGRLSFKQYMPLKPSKWGVKFWVITDASTGFCLDWQVYTGRNEQQDRGGDSLTEYVVKNLSRSFYGTGRHLFMDSFYSSPNLYEHLAENKLGACGTVRLSRRGIPPAMREASSHSRKGDDPSFFRKGNLLGVTWHDTKRVSVLSTVHGTGTENRQVRDRRSATGRRNVKKPVAVTGYNKSMGGVDRLDQRMSYYKYPHRHMKWYMVVYHFILEVALVNAFLSFNIATKRKNNVRKFRLEVINGLIDNFSRDVQPGRPRELLRNENMDPRTAFRLTGKHFWGKTDVPDYKPDCIVCKKRSEVKYAGQKNKGRKERKQTVYLCKKCKLPMCLLGCFEAYHTKEKYW